MAHRPHPRGDEGELFSRFNAPLERAVRARVYGPAATVEDACAFAWEQLLRTQPDRGEGLFGWLVTVATREGWRLVRIERRTALLVLGDTADGDGGLSGHIRAVELLEALAALPPVQRRLLVRRAAGYSYRELGALERRGINYVDKHLGRGRRRLRQRDTTFVPAA
jgi:DNA-directed RNA polymerase specialized sigma24 family protein